VEKERENPFTPVAKVGENVLLLPAKQYYRVVWVEPIPRIVVDFGAFGAGEVKEKEKAEAIELFPGELGHFRFTPIDDLEILVFQPRAVARFTTTAVQAKIDRWTPPELSEIYVWERAVPYLTVRNPRRYPTAMGRVCFWGWRMQLEKLVEPPKRWAAVVTAGKAPPAPA